MAILIIGLLVFFSVHSIRLVADHWRSAFISRYGAGAWRILYSVASIVGLVLIIWGYGESRTDPVLLWAPPTWTRHLALLLTLLAFILLAAASVPRNHIKQRIGHPMFAGVKVWALAHLLANGRLSDLLLFGAFLVWAIVGFSRARKRDRLAGIEPQAGGIAGTLGTLAGGIVAWGVFVIYLHRVLIGVPPI